MKQLTEFINEKLAGVNDAHIGDVYNMIKHTGCKDKKLLLKAYTVITENEKSEEPLNTAECMFYKTDERFAFSDRATELIESALKDNGKTGIVFYSYRHNGNTQPKIVVLNKKDGKIYCDKGEAVIDENIKGVALAVSEQFFKEDIWNKSDDINYMICA